ncbi:MAG: sigma 54-interacting transcriptional regulator, partial [Candidatus Cloacimonadota bacterium]|nr:sigma 54-interacting transcriptional regulator [Candidatus Cloacimonadota bacterium]
QSALFGHRKGAFTGASYDHIGYFEEAHNGTIFLDEISEMPADIQANLLRILENKVVKRLGDNKNRKTDFRLVSATNKDIYSLIEKNKFRFDLFNRINTVEIHIPPLRDRKEDIPLLIEYFFNVISHKLQKKQPVISQIAINMLCDYDFPGNIRELKNIVERLILFSKNGKINKEDVYFLNSGHSEEIQSKNLVNLNLATNEKQLIMEALKRTGNVQIEAAKLLGIPAYTLNRRLKKMKN